MLLSRGTSRNHVLDLQLACILAGVAGALNTAAFHAVGFFSANMTGNASALSERAASGEWHSALFFLGIVLIFIIGASVSTAFIHAGQRHGVKDIYAITIFAEAVLMTLLGLCEWFVLSLHRPSVLILGLSFLMGVQNSVVTLISDGRVRTTHISGISTDIGIELGVLFDLLRGKPVTGDAHGYRTKFKLHLLTVLSFVAGGMAGVLIYGKIGTALLFVTAALLLILATGAIFRARTRPERLPTNR
ncbi:putative transmembrane protein [Candidatus Burkholderia pumila]|uniref:Transmembrane protein n=1 Tax=Candidatus Burkholderia pumila TaxID=1090375 RepID=A0ABR5HN24_9BURK|nr:putative transmembrane protein [Candidatus Burkholderia pumila]